MRPPGKGLGRGLCPLPLSARSPGKSTIALCWNEGLERDRGSAQGQEENPGERGRERKKEERGKKKTREC